MKLAERTFRRNDYVLTSPFGMRTHPITKVRTMHSGADYGTKRQRWSQYALEDGVVVKSSFNSIVGNIVEIEYKRLGIMLSYRHLHSAFVYKGQEVNENTVIGLTGTTGSSTGIHLHLGLMINGIWVDPEKYVYKPSVIDGVWDPEFTGMLQKYFKTTVDKFISGQRKILPNVKIMRYGLFGSQLVRAIQKWLGVNVTGQLDKNTIEGLQMRMGTIVDGVVSRDSMLVREMKRRLMEGGSL